MTKICEPLPVCLDDDLAFGEEEEDWFDQYFLEEKEQSQPSQLIEV